MTDFSSIPNPPRIEPVEKVKPGAPPSAQTAPSGEAGFQNQLNQALDHIQQGAQQVENLQPSFETMPNAMDQAKDLFAESMHAHQLMKDLIDPDEGSSPPKE